MDPRTLQFVIPLLIILPILYFRMRRSLKPQRLKPQTLLIRPAIIIVLAGIALAASPPRPQDIFWFALAALVGAVAGWSWGKLTQLHLHPEDGTVMSTSSQAGMLVLIVLVLFRYGIRAGIGLGHATMHLDVALFTDISITFSALLFSARGLEIYLRSQKLLKSPS
jgi:Na+/proline symporter